MLNDLIRILGAIGEIASKKTLVVAGVGKSGTTWMQKLLDSHPAIFCPGEGKFDYLITGLVYGVESYNKMLTVANKAVYGNAPYYRTWDDSTMRQCAQFMIALCWMNAGQRDLSLVTYVGDKDTHYGSNIAAWNRLFMADAKLIYMMRDGRDSALSNLFHAQRSYSDAMKTGEALQQYLVKYARDWAAEIKKVRRVFAAYPERYMEVRYEDLISNPEATLERVLGFLEVDRDPALIERIVSANDFSRMSGGRKRGEEDRMSFFRKGVAGDWKQHFDGAAAAAFRINAGGLLEDLGYTDD